MCWRCTCGIRGRASRLQGVVACPDPSAKLGTVSRLSTAQAMTTYLLQVHAATETTKCGYGEEVSHEETERCVVLCVMNREVRIAK
jgi:hypothetical protein